jgi:hypothetical protein
MDDGDSESEDIVIDQKALGSALGLGLILGVTFGVVDLAFSWLAPLSDDSIGALLRFYGPMFFLWAFASFRAARREGRWLSGVVTGLVVAFATFCVFVLLNLLRVNLFFDDMIGRADWQNMVARFRASGSDSLRSFVNASYLEDAPLKIAVASVIGVVMGAVGGTVGRMRAWLAA